MKEKNGKFYIKFLFVLSIILIVLGVILILLSFRKEVIEDNYIIKDYTEYKPGSVSLSDGEMLVTKDIKYLGDGVFRLTYINYSLSDNLLASGTYFYITDMYSKQFKALNTSVYVNGVEYKFPKYQIASKEGIRVNYTNNVLDVEVPSSILKDNNEIVVFVKLDKISINKKSYISQDTYYTFVPNPNNSFYKKKISQSYVVEGNAYIIVDKK